MARLWNLPVISAIENNSRWDGTSIARPHSNPCSTDAAKAFAFRELGRWHGRARVVRGAAEVALAWARVEGPLVVEFMNLSLSRPLDVRSGDNRSRERFRKFVTRDPIVHAVRDTRGDGR